MNRLYAIIAVCTLLIVALLVGGSVRGCELSTASYNACVEKTQDPLACDAARRGR